jgi:hypothetical protein
VKIIGLRYHYFTVPWNLFDFILVMASILSIVMEDMMVDLPVSPTLLRVVRVFRIGRILRLIKVIFTLVIDKLAKYMHLNTINRLQCTLFLTKIKRNHGVSFFLSK